VKLLSYLALIYIQCFEQSLRLSVYLYTNTNQFCSALLPPILQALPSFILIFFVFPFFISLFSLFEIFTFHLLFFACYGFSFSR